MCNTVAILGDIMKSSILLKLVLIGNNLLNFHAILFSFFG